MKHFDYDAVSGPSIKRIKNLQLYSTEDLRNNGAAIANIGTIMLRAQEYYVAKTAKAQALMQQMEPDDK